MLYLHTLGSVYLTRDSGPPLGGAASQRRLLALLTVLAAAGDAGVSRDRLVSILWPDAEVEKGRHSLTQALYQARRALECEDLFFGGTDLRLNAERISSDVRDLELATRAGDFAGAVSHYRGEFLADFYLPGNPEFDQWADAQRRRVAGQIEFVLEQLAVQATASGDVQRLVDWRRRIAALDPLNSRAAFLLIEALRDAGDAVGARRHLQVHETLVRAELDTDLAPEFGTLRDSLRRPSLPDLGGRRPDAPAPIAAGQEPPAVRPPRGSRQVPFGMRRVAALSFLVAVVSVIAIREAANRLTAPRFERQVLVAPFRTSGAEPSLDFLREGLVELISIRLGGDSAMQPADPGAVLRAWRGGRALDSADLEPATLVQLAGRFGARAVITGSVVGSPRHLVISASIVDVGDTARRAFASVEGPLDSLTSMVDRISGRMMIASAGETQRFRRTVTPSPAALRAFLEGLAAYRRGRYFTAIRQFEAANRQDSTFALGAMYLALAADKVNGSYQHARALSFAWQNQAQLSESDRLLLAAFAGPRYPAASTMSEQLAAWEAAVAWSPGRTDALIEYAEHLLRSGRVLGAANPTGRAGTLLRQVLHVDPRNRHAQALLMALVIRDGPSSLGEVDAGENLPAWATWAVATMRGDSASLRRIRKDLETLPDGDLTRIARMGQFTGLGIEDVDRVLQIKRGRAVHGLEQLDAILAQHSLAINQGRPALALDLTRQLEETQPGWRAHLRLRVLDALYGGGDPTAAAQAAARLAGFTDTPEPANPFSRSIRRADVCVLAQWRLAAGETKQVRRAISVLRSAALPRGLVPVGANPHACAELLEAGLAVATNPLTAAPRLAAVDSLVLGGPAAGDAGAYAHILMARLYERIGRHERALEAIRRRPTVSGWPRYLATARRDEGRLAMLTGDSGGGLAVYRKYLAFRTAPEAPVANEVELVRDALEAAAKEPPKVSRTGAFSSRRARTRPR